MKKSFVRVCLLSLILVAALLFACEKSGGSNNGNKNKSTDSDIADTATATDADTDTDTDGDSDSDSGGDGGADGGKDTETGVDECADTPYAIEVNPINILILLDRSRSMTIFTDDGKTFANITADAINAVVKANDDKDLVNFGLAAFPSMQCWCDDEDPTLENINDRCSLDFQCTPTDAEGDPKNHNPLVPIGADNAADIATKLSSIGTCGGTPICRSLEWARGYLSSLSADLAKYPTYVLLATDGAPNCNDKLNVSDCVCTSQSGECDLPIQCLDDICPQNQAMKLAGEGFKTLVVGVGETVSDPKWSQTMTKIAEHGGTTDYHPATDPSSLQTALENIINQMIPCTFDVPWSDVPATTEAGTVHKSCARVRVFGKAPGTGSKTQIPRSEGCSNPDGWYWKNLNGSVSDTTPLEQCGTIELCGGTCNKLRSGSFETITASFGCAPDLVF